MPYSAADIIRAIEQHGFVMKSGKGKRGSHKTWARPPTAPGELHRTVVITITAKEIPAGTLASICRQIGVEKTTLDDWIKQR